MRATAQCSMEISNKTSSEGGITRAGCPIVH
jgi:hypothetical protein